VIFDPVGAEIATQAVKAIARYGRIVIIGFASGSAVTLDAFDMLLRQYSAIGLLAAGDSWDAIPRRREAAFDQLIDLVDKDVLQVPTPRVMPFAEVPRSSRKSTPHLPARRRSASAEPEPPYIRMLAMNVPRRRGAHADVLITWKPTPT
jgi:hypothetical protein